MDGWMDGWINRRWMDRQMYVCMDEWVDGMDGWVERWMDGGMDDGWMYRCMYVCMDGWIDVHMYG